METEYVLDIDTHFEAGEPLRVDAETARIIKGFFWRIFFSHFGAGEPLRADAERARITKVLVEGILYIYINITYDERKVQGRESEGCSKVRV